MSTIHSSSVLLGCRSVHTLPEFRIILDSSPITEADRETIADQAEAMIDGLYVHLLQKRAMYGIDPSQRPAGPRPAREGPLDGHGRMTPGPDACGFPPDFYHRSGVGLAAAL